MAFGWWIAIAIGLGVIEVLTVDLFFLMLALAALVTSVVSLAGVGWVGQAIVFAIASAILLVLVRPWAKSFLLRHSPNVLTNAQALVGKTALVTELVTPEGGRVKLEGDIWSARSQTDSIPVGATVTVIEIAGATAVVTATVPSSQYH